MGYKYATGYTLMIIKGILKALEVGKIEIYNLEDNLN